ncbi:unnamed protein product [Eruca vesicaria subsp. sativa]|uniref:EF-hand domain-containing protein n=1 Tax=Eruca vesicaria subsp. sativa TaxID=29727 RepID=A0ABC8LHJ7_ERUVS|nr:unnamed protein product [Eruca vesicaria subsp. sativa]
MVCEDGKSKQIQNPIHQPDEAAMLEKISTVMLNKLKVDKLREKFWIHDVDKNGFITKPELRYSMTKDGGEVTKEEVNKIFEAADVDYDGQISYDEFVKLNAKCKNQNGFVTAADYQKFVLTVTGKKVTDEDARNFIESFDVDGDGRVSYDEFVKLTR